MGESHSSSLSIQEKEVTANNTIGEHDENGLGTESEQA